MVILFLAAIILIATAGPAIQDRLIILGGCTHLGQPKAELSHVSDATYTQWRVGRIEYYEPILEKHVQKCAISGEAVPYCHLESCYPNFGVFPIIMTPDIENLWERVKHWNPDQFQGYSDIFISAYRDVAYVEDGYEYIGPWILEHPYVWRDDF